MDINARTEIYCIFGNPVRHSLSPAIHNAAFRELGINAAYCAFEPDAIAHAVNAMRALGIRGASVTIPFKVSVMPCIDFIDPLAASIGAVNTLVNNNGRIEGYNTDGAGALLPLKKKVNSLRGKSVMIIGNGGSARAIAFTLLQEGANILIAGRNEQKIQRLAADLFGAGPARHALLAALDRDLMQSTDVIINTTPVGMHPEVDATPLNAELLLPRHVVFDIVYSPDTTKLLATAAERGCTVIKGIEMLISQAMGQFRLWTGLDAPESLIRDTVTKLITDPGR
ncbi:MAG TPA: shikimate dehydrogenase [Spirochaetota bacterium]|nr:shikimate dehydrogenase [Spirochaetota bacterium]HPI89168.1 shikimate dehydrogenase [Spirochaetota bacterium]HPR46837.1 shikimate dehydrogenase [Spirochaetota bacterium]